MNRAHKLLAFAGMLAVFGSIPSIEVKAASTNVGMGAAHVFTPATITIIAGDTVIWTNTSANPHTVTADDNSFDSGNMNAGATFSRTFGSPGTYRYYCLYHGAAGGIGMSGVITAQAAAPPPPSSSPTPSPPPPTPAPAPSPSPSPTPSPSPSPAASPTPGPVPPPSQSPAPIVSLPSSLDEGDVIIFPEGPTIYLVRRGSLHGFDTYQSYQVYLQSSQKTLKKMAGSASEFPISFELASQALNLPKFFSGALVNDRGTIYLIRQNKKIPFASLEAFLGLGYSLRDVTYADLSEIVPVSQFQIFSPAQAHPWGSWLVHQGTVYYAHPAGLIGVSSWEIFLNNGGRAHLILPANQADLAILQNSETLPLLTQNDARIFKP